MGLVIIVGGNAHKHSLLGIHPSLLPLIIITSVYVEQKNLGHLKYNGASSAVWPVKSLKCM